MSLKVFIGYDERQPIAFQVCAHSVWERASKPVEVIRLELSKLPIRRHGLTSFTYSRFLVPYLSGYTGTSLFLDSDILVRCDVTALEPQASVHIVKGERKFEWASVMLFDNEKFKHLTPAFIENPANVLYDWKWATDIGELPKEYNHLVGYDAENPDAKIVHFTQGIPVWFETVGCEFAEEWKDTLKRSMSTVSFAELMGRSVHVPYMKAGPLKVMK